MLRLSVWKSITKLDVFWCEQRAHFEREIKKKKRKKKILLRMENTHYCQLTNSCSGLYFFFWMKKKGWMFSVLFISLNFVFSFNNSNCPLICQTKTEYKRIRIWEKWDKLFFWLVLVVWLKSVHRHQQSILIQIVSYGNWVVLAWIWRIFFYLLSEDVHTLHIPKLFSIDNLAYSGTMLIYLTLFKQLKSCRIT